MDTTIDNLPIIDHEASLKLAGNNQELANDMLEMLVKNLPDDIAIIQSTYANNDIDKLRKELHKLRGGVAYCGLPRLKHILAALDTYLKNQPPEEASELINALNNEVALLVAHYQRK